MKNNLNFLIEVAKLKKMPRTGFLWLGIKIPETIAQHVFRVAILNWLLARKKKNPRFSLIKIIKISLVHDLCEVYAGDMTPYWGLLPKDPKKRKEALKKWVHLPQKTKEKRDRIKFLKEKKSLEKLVKKIELGLEREILNCWLGYEKLNSPEGRFVKQGDKVETLLQALEYWGSQPNSPVPGWWEEIAGLVDNSNLIEFLGKLEDHFYKNKKADGEIKFLLEIGKLKSMPRTGWVLRKVKNPETIAEHGFLLAMAVWVLSRKDLNLEKMLKMSLVYEICEVYGGDATPYDGMLKGKKKEKILERWLRSSEKEKEKKFLKDYREEKKALEKLVLNLPKDFAKEIISLWDECKRSSTAEGKFVNQVYWLVTYLQALQYFAENKKFPIIAWYEQMREFIEDPELLELMSLMENKFIARKRTKK
jgi:putative hydrolases of HD superfamily